MSLVYVSITILLTVYGQLIVKWRVLEAGAMPDAWSERLYFFLGLLVHPWVMSVYVAVLFAGVSWMAAMTKLELNYAYPFMSATFVLVTLLSALFFQEALTLPKVIGLAFIVVGLVIGSQG